MPKIRFRDVNFTPKRLRLVAQASAIVRHYLARGYRMSLRQLYYRLVATSLIPNTPKDYKRLGHLISDARLAGLIDWNAIEDRGRVARVLQDFKNLREMIDASLATYRLPRWKGQPAYVELWVEKDALSGVLAPVANEFHVTLCVNKGYSSQSAMYEASRRFIRRIRFKTTPKRPVLFYLGDHDPSGEDMVRDIRDRMAMFGVDGLEVRKLALTIEQVREHNPPPNPAKVTDPRAADYIDLHGPYSWEVDALPVDVLVSLIRNAFMEVIDMPKMDAIREQETRDRERLLAAVTAITNEKPPEAGAIEL